MKKKKKPKGYDYQPTDPPPWFGCGQRFNFFLGWEKGEGGEVGAGAASSWRERRRKGEVKKEKKKREKSRRLSTKTILQLLQNCIGPTIPIGQEIRCLP